MRNKTSRAAIIQRICAAAIVVILLRLIAVTASAEVAPVQPDIRAEYGAYIDEIAAQYSICPELIEAMIETESCGPADVVSSAGCIGLMQVSPKWHMDRMAKLGVCDLFDPYTNILVATDYLAELFDKYGDLPMVLMTYNGSSDAWRRWGSGDYTDYAVKIMERAEKLERQRGK